MNIQDAYNQWAETYDSDINFTRDLDQKVTQIIFEGQRFNSILELGCGTGKNTRLLAQIGQYIHAVDFSQGMIEKAKRKIQASNVRYSMADITNRWPCNDQSYDLIVCNLVLDTLKNLAAYSQKYTEP